MPLMQRERWWTKNEGGSRAYNAENQRMQTVNAMDKNLPPKDLLYVKLKKVPLLALMFSGR
ncbi:Hypothetical predicted protein [Paramuricea clavata]|uniref:Uncharacterized protein n=1 Tax=Paramuricea clavata TaxID=317549 RepID=A0A6S7GN77_PARCT|nr:Hypothetical predicted protein [Paramuricea clavata]